MTVKNADHFGFPSPIEDCLSITDEDGCNNWKESCFRPLSGTTYLFYNEYTQMNMNEVSFPSPIGDCLSITTKSRCTTEHTDPSFRPLSGTAYL